MPAEPEPLAVELSQLLHDSSGLGRPVGATTPVGGRHCLRDLIEVFFNLIVYSRQILVMEVQNAVPKLGRENHQCLDEEGVDICLFGQGRVECANDATASLDHLQYPCVPYIRIVSQVQAGAFLCHLNVSVLCNQ